MTRLSLFESALEDLLARVPDEQLRSNIRLVLTDEYAPEEAFRELSQTYEARGGSPGPASGLLGFIRLLRVADRSKAEHAESPWGLLEDPAVRRVIADLYRLPKEFELDDHAAVIALGDSSFVVETMVADGRHLAMKFLLPWFLGSKTLQRELGKYFASRRPLRSVTTERVAVACAGDSGAGWLATPFVAGVTLADRLRREGVDWSKQLGSVDEKEKRKRKSEPLDAEVQNRQNKAVASRIPEMGDVADRIMQSLALLEQHGDQAHGDLRAENILLVEDDLARPTPVLIDFGPPPEVLRRAPDRSILTASLPTHADDLRGLANLLLDVLVPAPLRDARDRAGAGDLGESDEEVEQRRSDAQEVLRRIVPRIGVIVDGFLLPEPRVPASVGTEPGKLFEQLRIALRDEIQVFMSFQDGEGDPLTAIRGPASWRKWSELNKIGDLLRQGRYSRGLDRAARVSLAGRSDWPRIDTWMKRYALAWKFTYGVFVLLLLLDLFSETHVDVFSGTQIHHFLYRIYGQLPGGHSQWKHPNGVPVGFNHSALLMLDYRFVSLTTAGIAFVYYMNIFSTLPSVSRWFDLNMRLGPLIAMAMQVAGMIFFPYGFAWVAGAGGLFICANNLWWRKIVRRRLGKESEAYLSFRQWPMLMLFFCLGGLLIGILLAVRQLHDAWFYAVTLWALNVFKVYAQNCTRDAPRVRGWLSLAGYYEHLSIKWSSA